MDLTMNKLKFLKMMRWHKTMPTAHDSHSLLFSDSDSSHGGFSPKDMPLAKACVHDA